MRLGSRPWSSPSHCPKRIGQKESSFSVAGVPAGTAPKRSAKLRAGSGAASLAPPPPKCLANRHCKEAVPRFRFYPLPPPQWICGKLHGRTQSWLQMSGRRRRPNLKYEVQNRPSLLRFAAISATSEHHRRRTQERANPSIEGTLSGLRPPSAPHVKR